MSMKKHARNSKCGPAEITQGQQRRGDLGSEAWLCGEEHNVDAMVPEFEAVGWRVIGRGPFCIRLASAETRVPDMAALVREHPDVSVLVRIYDKSSDRLKIIAGSTLLSVSAVEEMHVLSHAEHYDVPAAANMFDY